jgi:transcription initiation factor TFIIA small subunit
VWTFIIKDINFKLDNAVNLQSDRIKIVAMNAKKPGEA